VAIDTLSIELCAEVVGRAFECQLVSRGAFDQFGLAKAADPPNLLKDPSDVWQRLTVLRSHHLDDHCGALGEPSVEGRVDGGRDLPRFQVGEIEGRPLVAQKDLALFA